MLFEANIDLKWSLWSSDRDIWANAGYGKEYSYLMEAHQQDIELLVNTAPKKEIRFGELEFAHGTVAGVFTFEWDEPEDLCSGWGDWRDSIPASAHSEWLSEHGFMASSYSIEFEFELENLTFEEMMEKIDSYENKLIEDERRLSKEHEEWMLNFAAPEQIQ